MAPNWNKQHVGSEFDDFLQEERLLEETEAVAAQRVGAYRTAGQPKGEESPEAAPAVRAIGGENRG